MEAEVCKFAPDDWRVLSIADVCIRVTSGGTPSRKRPDFYQNGMWPWVKTQELTDGWLEDTEEKITEEAVAESSAKVLPENTVLMAMYGATVGQLGLLRRPMTCNQACSAIIVDPVKADFRYLYYQLFNSRPQIRSLATGAAQQNLSGVLIKSLRYPFPPLPEQKTIARILGTLDDKIELNRRMNATLEAMARALFQSWFVDFDPVHAKAAGRQPSGMDAATAALFPDSFQDSEFGEIPAGWIVKPIGDVVDCVGGSTPSTSDPAFWDGGVHHWTTPKDFSSLQSPILIDSERKITDAGLAKISSGLLPIGTVLLSSRAPVGYLAISAIPVAINQGFIAMKCGAYASPEFVLNWCQSNMTEIKGRATGTTFPEISKKSFRPIPLILPPAGLMAAFTETARPLYNQINANLQQSRTLATLRDTLLPKLLCGEVTIDNALS